MATVGRVVSGLFTETAITVEVVLFPEVSVARAANVWEPFATSVVLSQLNWYGAAVMGVPRLAPSSRNCTLETATLSAALAVTRTLVPNTVLPPSGAVSETVGGTLSGGTMGVVMSVWI